MPDQSFQLTTVTRLLGDELELAEVPGFPEVSCLENRHGRALAGLRSKVRRLLEDNATVPAQWLYRRCAGKGAKVMELTLEMSPLKRQAGWQNTVELTFEYVQWEESADLHVGFVPALDVKVMAAKAEQIPARVEAHVRLALVDRARHVTLTSLVEAQQQGKLRVDVMEVTANLKTPKTLMDEREGTKKEASVLEQVAAKLSTSFVCVVYEMDAVVRQMADCLEARQPASVLLVGPPGVGKTAAAREYARKRQLDNPGKIVVWSTSGARLIAGQSGFGEWQQQCRRLCQEAAASKVILHLGQLSELMQVGQHSANTESIASFLRPWIARGEVLTIAECTPEQLSIIERQDPHVVAAFQQVVVAEPDVHRTRRILSAVFAKQSRRDSDAAASSAGLDWLHRLHLRYATYSANPGRPIRFLSTLVAEQPPEEKTVLTVAGVTTAFTRETGLPEVLLRDDLILDLEVTRKWFEQRVIGQPEAVSAVLDVVATIKTRLNRPRQPLASFLFVGPTGTGKTELAKALAEFLFGHADRLARFDLSEFSDAFLVQRLIGGTGGNAEGLLTARVREQPFSVLLFDEFKKADPSFFDLLLQLLGDGRLTDAAGRVADFCNTVVIMTSNLGAREFQRGSAGFTTGRGSEESGAHFDEAVRQFLRPEIYNRLGAILRFHALSRQLMLQVTRRHLDLLRQRDGVRLRGVDLRLEAGVEEHLADRGYDPIYGARPLKRVLERELMVPLAEALNAVRLSTVPLAAMVTLDRNALKIEVRQLPAKDGGAQPRLAADFAKAVTTLRRDLQRMKDAGCVVELDNEVAVLAVLERRIARGKWKGLDETSRLRRLADIREGLRELAGLSERVDVLETETVAKLHLDGRLDTVRLQPDYERAQEERGRLQKVFFRLSFTQPDDVVLAWYSEDREWLKSLLGVHLEHAAALNGRVMAFDFVLPPAGRDSQEGKPLRETAKNLDRPLADAPAGWVGVIVHLRGELFYPRFLHEAGIHKRLVKGAKTLCLVEASAAKFEDYTPPAGIHRGGTISEKGNKPRRTFDTDKHVVTDAALGEQDWPRGEPNAIMRRLIEERLREVISEAV